MLILCLLACSPENEEVQDEHVQVAPPQEALDSIANTAKDAVKTDENNISPTFPLPPALLQQLADKYPQWQYPELMADAVQQAVEHTESPAITRGDFTGDNLQDIALQLQKGDKVMMVAAVQQQDGNYQLYELMQDIMFNERGKLKSLYYLYRIRQGEEVENPNNANKLELPHDAIAVGVGKETTMFMYQDGRFERIALGEEH